MIDDRTVWTTRKLRFGDLRVGDVIHNAYGKWEAITEVRQGDPYSTVKFRTTALECANVHLVLVQTAKPS